jgi:hypothetical protein
MKQLFAPERVKLRAVLEAASLTSVASVDAFKGATANEADGGDAPTVVSRAAAPGGLDPEPNEHTVLMPGAPARPPPPREPPSIAAMALPAGPTTTVPAAESPAKTARSSRRAPRRESRVGLFVAVTAAIVVVALGVFIAIGGRARDEAAVREESRAPAVVTTELTSFSRVARPKAGTISSSDARDNVVGPGGRTSVARRGGGGSTLGAATAAQGPGPGSEPDSAPTTRTHAKATSSSPGKLDETDPWAAKNATQ